MVEPKDWLPTLSNVPKWRRPKNEPKSFWPTLVTRRVRDSKKIPKHMDGEENVSWLVRYGTPKIPKLMDGAEKIFCISKHRPWSKNSTVGHIGK